MGLWTSDELITIYKGILTCNLPNDSETIEVEQLHSNRFTMMQRNVQMFISWYIKRASFRMPTAKPIEYYWLFFSLYGQIVFLGLQY